MKKSEKPFDAVKMMREIRDKLSMEFRNMSFEVEQQYIRARLQGKQTKPQHARSGTQTA